MMSLPYSVSDGRRGLAAMMSVRLVTKFCHWSGRTISITNYLPPSKETE